MNPAWLALAFTILGWIVMIVLYTFKGGRALGEKEREIEALKTDIENLHRAISVNKDMNEAQWKDFSKDYMQFRLRVARQLGVNGE